ncbi:5-formyltetrahydrofolate cyclo-ligase [Paracoccus sp. PARArs4]|uniref:5-formyltetrahydrofolate cyclo-ligase n=1 Tax=Paracoccus sp. PARArs4 TaxID=2853442 RepID=UPI0024A683F9|nr:5-formyltetrahydrofolate cyclo-ligase [Paracoccus sp. PARArs4]
MTTKATLRAQALAARAAGGDADALTRHLANALLPFRRGVVAAYWPIRDEADPRPALQDHQGVLVLPVVTGRDRPLVFREWQPDAPLVRGDFGVSHPGPDAPEMRPDVVIVPLAGFDGQGNRLGYGGGFYDRTLERLRAQGPVLAMGLAFACQRVEAIPVEPFDQPLDLIVTDAGAVFPEAAG